MAEPAAPAAPGRLARLLPAARVVGFVAALGIVVYVAVRAAADVELSQLEVWPLALAVGFAVVWWVLLARGWGVLVTGRATRRDVSLWCRTQALRFLPGGIWAPASRALSVDGGWVDRISTVAAENVIALCAALAIAGAAWTVAGEPLWLPLVAAVALPVAGAVALPERARVSPARAAGATWNHLAAFAAYAAAAALVQLSVSGDAHLAEVVGAACAAWAVGLVVVIAPGGVGVREVVYVGLLAGLLPDGEAAAAAVALRLVTILAEVGVLVVAGRPR